MNTLENTVSMMKMLPESDLVKIQDFTKKLFNLHITDNPFKPLSEEDILRDLEISRNQIAQGKCKEMGPAIEGIRAKYGL